MQSTKLNMATLVGICSVLLAIINITSAQSSCRTPDGWNGNCMALEQCRPLYKLLLRGNKLSPDQRNFLAKSQCGREGRQIFVCCPKTFTTDDLPNCGANVEDKIVGGERVGITEFTWLALLHYTKFGTRGGFYCGGSVIHENYVLTAAHCIKGGTVTRQRFVLDSVRLGENDLRSNNDCQEGECAGPVQDIPIAESIVHEDYVPSSRSQEHDIALLRLQRPATFTNYSRPICLPLLHLQNRNYDGAPLTVAGFGRTENGRSSEYKLKLELTGMNWNQCSNVFRTVASTILSNQVLCAGGEEGKDSCGGDSGGPLVAENVNQGQSFSYLVGIVSFGAARCGTEGLPGVYTRVDKYIDWILDHMRKQ